MSRVTIKTVAEAVGVTHGTVSRALRGDPRVKPATVRAVMAAAEQLGYRPSRLGRALRTQRSGTLAIVVSYLHDPFYSEVIQAVHDRLFPLETSLFVAATESEPKRQETVARVLAEQGVDGVFVCCLPGMTPPFQELSQSVPVVTINCDPDLHTHSVVHDDAAAVEQCLHYLMERGHRRVGFLGAENGGYAQTVRLRAFLEAGGALALKAIHRSATDVKVDVGEAAMKEWIEEGELPSALICFNDTVAIGALKACRESGLRVPEDLSLLSFDDIEMSRYVQPSLTTFRQPRYAMGEAAAEMMLAQLSGTTPESATYFLGELVERETVAGVP